MRVSHHPKENTVNVLHRASAAVAAAIVLFTAATVCAQADERPTLAVAKNAPNQVTAPARINGSPYTQVPAFAQIAGLHGSAIVEVDLDESGRVLDATIVHSSGNLMLDRAAIATVRSASYEPARSGNVPVAGAFDIAVDFASEN